MPLSSGVTPSPSARKRASPAPAPTPKPTAAALPARPSGPAARNGTVEPIASPSFRPTVSSYPGAASNGFLAASAYSLIFSRAAFSVSSGRRADAPTAADSTRPTAPGRRPFSPSFICPPSVVSGFSSGAISGSTSGAADCCRTSCASRLASSTFPAASALRSAESSSAVVAITYICLREPDLLELTTRHLHQPRQLRTLGSLQPLHGSFVEHRV